jgi:soluble lytic murein transglycosylase-like protein
MRWTCLLLASTAVAQTDAMRSAIEKQKTAVAQQMESIRKQAKSLSVWLPPGESEPVPPEAEPSCDALSDTAVAPIIEAAAKAQSLQPKLLRAVIEQESGYHPCAVSSKGAKGLMQLMPDTAADLKVNDAFDPKENIEAGAKYLKQLLYRYGGDLAQALGAYNAGPTTVDEAGGVPKIRETKDYVKAILDKVNPPESPQK